MLFRKTMEGRNSVWKSGAIAEKTMLLEIDVKSLLRTLMD